MVGSRHQRLGQHIEITPLARQAMHADDHMGRQGIAPSGVSHTMYTLGIWAINSGNEGLCHNVTSERKTQVCPQKAVLSG